MLDTEFYRMYYSDMHERNDDEILHHWNNLGKIEGRFPNPFVAKDYYLNNSDLPDDFILDAYLRLNLDVKNSIRWDFEAIIHYKEYGINENREFREPLHTIASEATDRSSINYKSDAHINSLTDDSVPLYFNIASYLAINQDVHAKIEKIEDGFMHYVNHGTHEERKFTPMRYDAGFIYQLYGVKISSKMDVQDVVIFLRNKTDSRIDDLLFFDETEICLFHNVNIPYFSNCFDHSYYAFKYNLDRTIYNNRAKCIKHFCEVGQYKQYDISADCAFDHVFYASEYYHNQKSLDDTDLSYSALYKDWIVSNSTNIKWPNLNLYVYSKYNIKIPVNIKIFVEESVAAKDTRTTQRPSEVFEYIIEGNIDHIFSRPGDNFYAPEFYASIADRLSLQGRFQDAARIYSFILAETPHYPRALNHWADQAQRSNEIWHAIYLRQIAIENESANEWTYLNLSSCLIDVDNLSKAVHVLKLGVLKFPADVGLKAKLKEIQIKYFYQVWDNIKDVYIDRGNEDAVNLIDDAVSYFDKSAKISKVPGTSKDSLNVAIYANCDIKQCEFYRVNLREEQLKKIGCNVFVYNYTVDTQKMLDNIFNIDFCIIYRVPAFPNVIDAIKKLTDMGITTIYDVDDLIFDANHFPPPIESYSGLINERQYADMACGVSLFAHAASLCDFGMTSTDALSSALRNYVKTREVFCLPNSLGRTHYEAMQNLHPRSNKAVTIFYGSGTKAHKKDLDNIIIPALKSLFMSGKTEIKVVFMGDISAYEDLKEWAGNIIYLPATTNIMTYWAILKQSDINLAILNKSTFNDSKSEIKWMEAAMFGIPSVVSSTLTYNSVVSHKKTGYICHDSQEFYTALSELVSSESLRKNVGDAARDFVIKNYNFDLQSNRLNNIIKQTLSRAPAVQYRIVIVNVFYPPQAIGGATRVVHDNVRDLKKILGPSWQIDVICTLEGGTTPYQLDWYAIDDVRVFCITAKNHPSIDSFVTDTEMQAVFDTTIERIQPHLVHFHCIQRLTVSCVDAVKSRGIPYIITMHDGWWISPHQFLVNNDMEVETYDFSDNIDFGKITMEDYDRSRVLKHALDSASRVLTVSESFANICRSVGMKKIEVIENGVSNFKKIERKPDLNKKVTIGFFGGLSNHKGYGLIRNVFLNKNFSNIKLLIIDHAMHPNDRVVEQWGSTPVLMRGKAPQSQVDELYKSINVLLAPSVWPESYGLVTREALAFGCWVVGSDRGAVSDCIVEGKNGYVINVDNEDDLLRIIKYIDDNKDLHCQTPSFDIKIRTSYEQAEDLANLYAEILSKAQ